MEPGVFKNIKKFFVKKFKRNKKQKTINLGNKGENIPLIT